MTMESLEKRLEQLEEMIRNQAGAVNQANAMLNQLLGQKAEVMLHVEEMKVAAE